MISRSSSGGSHLRTTRQVACALMWTAFLSILLCTMPARAEPLPVVIAADINRLMPQMVERVKDALASTGHEFEWQVLPNKRSFQTLIEGKAAIELIRTTFQINDYPQLVAVQPSPTQVPFQMITSAKTKHFCSADEQAFKSMSVAGVIGVDAHYIHYYPKFGSHSELTSFLNAYRYVGLGRAEVTFLPQPVVAGISPQDLESLEICTDRIDVFPLQTLIHRDFLWVKESVEAAYRKAFAPN